MAVVDTTSRTNWLLLHGLSRDQRHWGDFPGVLQAATGGEVHHLDVPGVGTERNRLSPCSVAAITDDLRSRLDPGDGSWAVLGLSLGGMIAMDWCARYPDDFDRAVIVNTSGGHSPARQRYRPANVPTLAAAPFRSHDSGERAILRAMSNRGAADTAETARQWARWADESPASPRSLARQFWAVTRFDPPPKISVPLLVLASRADRVVSHRCAERLAAWYAAELRLHDTAGHDLPFDDPAWVCEQLTTWTAPAREATRP